LDKRGGIVTVPTQDRPTQDRPSHERSGDERDAVDGASPDLAADDLAADDGMTGDRTVEHSVFAQGDVAELGIEDSVVDLTIDDPGVVDLTTDDLGVAGLATDNGPVRDRPPRPMIDPRIRERRIEVLRAAGRRRLRVTLVLASTIVVVGLAYLAVHSPLLAVGHVRVSGERREPVVEILHAAGIRKGQALLFVDTGAAERRIEQLHWVANAHVRRDFPGTLDIEVTEYAPTAYVPMAGGKVALVASTGRVIGLSRSVPPHSVEVLGVRGVPVVGTTLSSPEAANVVSQFPPHLQSRVAAIDVGGGSPVVDLRAAAPAGRACLPVAGAVAGFEQVRLGGFDALRDKGVAALSVLNHLAGQPFSYIDVSVPQAPVSC
jgi:cell division protein FtsQ